MKDKATKSIEKLNKKKDEYKKIINELADASEGLERQKAELENQVAELKSEAEHDRETSEKQGAQELAEKTEQS